jgi:2-oxoglutarate ferredoxin oxidoreductase subunit beta
MAHIEQVHGVELAEGHPLDGILRAERLPLVWCPGCGLGIITKCLAEAIVRSEIPLDKHAVVAGIGCTSPLVSYMNLETHQAARGGAIAFATGLKAANPSLEVTVVACDSDLLSMEGFHLISAIRRSVDLTVICVNNLDHGMTGGQLAPTGTGTATTPYRTLEASLNLPYLAAAAGAPLVSRWTTLHVRQILKAMERAFRVQGLALVEIVSPCPPGFSESRKFKDGYAQMEYFRTCSQVDEDADLRKTGLSMRPTQRLVVGDFVDRGNGARHDVDYTMIEKAWSPAK